jgi:hypothetical protein
VQVREWEMNRYFCIQKIIAGNQIFNDQALHLILQLLSAIQPSHAAISRQNISTGITYKDLLFFPEAALVSWDDVAGCRGMSRDVCRGMFVTSRDACLLA